MLDGGGIGWRHIRQIRNDIKLHLITFSIGDVMNEAESINWELIKRDFILGRTNAENGKSLTLKQLAQKHNIPYGTLKNKASQEKWTALVNKQSKELNLMVTQKVQKEQVMTEVEIRTRNFEAGTVCLDRGLDRLSKLDEDDITPELALKMVQAGIKSRHEAAGLPDRFEVKGIMGTETSFEANLHQHQQFLQLAHSFQTHIENKSLLGDK